MRIRAALGNARRREYGVVTIPLPIPKEQYDSTIAMLEGLEIGAPLARDCLLYELQGPCPILKRLEGAAVNVDELDYLIRRLDSFTDGELAQFQGMAVKMGLNDMTDLIDLTFCCQQATVIAAFSDLEAVGRKHFLELNGGCASMEELAQMDVRRTALELILNGEGAVTPYGVVYDNGMKLERAYDGQHLPCYYYGGDMLAVGLLPREKPQDLSSATWVYLPATEVQISRAVARAGATVLEELSLVLHREHVPGGGGWGAGLSAGNSAQPERPGRGGGEARPGGLSQAGRRRQPGGAQDCGWDMPVGGAPGAVQTDPGRPHPGGVWPAYRLGTCRLRTGPRSGRLLRLYGTRPPANGAGAGHLYRPRVYHLSRDSEPGGVDDGSAG